MKPEVKRSLENIKVFGPIRPLVSSLLQHCTDHIVTYQAGDGPHKILFEHSEIESGAADELLAAIEQFLADNGLGEFVTLEAEAVSTPIVCDGFTVRIASRQLAA